MVWLDRRLVHGLGRDSSPWPLWRFASLWFFPPFVTYPSGNGSAWLVFQHGLIGSLNSGFPPPPSNAKQSLGPEAGLEAKGAAVAELEGVQTRLEAQLAQYSAEVSAQAAAVSQLTARQEELQQGMREQERQAVERDQLVTELQAAKRGLEEAVAEKQQDVGITFSPTPNAQ